MRKFFVFFLFALLLITPPLIAQEETQEPNPPTEIPPSPTLEPTFTDIPTNTPLPTETPTELPTATLWPAETATATQTELTPELTQALASETATASVIATNTEAATSTATASATALSNLPNYMMLLDEDLMNPRSDLVLQNNGLEQIHAIQDFYISNTSIILEFSLISGSVWVSLRRDAGSEYRVVLTKEGSLSLYRGNELLTMSSVLPLDSNFHRLKLTAYNNSFIVDFDELSRIVISDDSLTQGYLAFGTSLNATAQLNRIQILMEKAEFDAIIASHNAVPASMARPSRSLIPNVQNIQSTNGFANTILYSNTNTQHIYAVDMNDCSTCDFYPFIEEEGVAFDEAKWSPNGSFVAFVRRSYISGMNVNNLFIMPSDGSEAPQSFISPFPYTEYDWSLDGIAYIQWTNAENNKDLAILNCSDWLNPASCASPEIFQTGNQAENYPTWSPTGKIALTQRTCPTSCLSTDRLVVLYQDGTNDVIFEDYSTGLDWSPDGRYLAFDADHKIYIYDVLAETLDEVLLDADEVDYMDPTWSPDSTKFVVYGEDWDPDDYGDNTSALYVIDMLDENPSPQLVTALSRDYDLGFPTDWGFAEFCFAPSTATPTGGIESIRGGEFNIMDTGDNPICGGTPVPTATLWPTVSLPTDTPTATPTASFTPLPTPTVTPIPLPTNTPSPTATPTVCLVERVVITTGVKFRDEWVADRLITTNIRYIIAGSITSGMEARVYAHSEGGETGVKDNIDRIEAVSWLGIHPGATGNNSYKWITVRMYLTGSSTAIQGTMAIYGPEEGQMLELGPACDETDLIGYPPPTPTPTYAPPPLRYITCRDNYGLGTGYDFGNVNIRDAKNTASVRSMGVATSVLFIGHQNDANVLDMADRGIIQAPPILTLPPEVAALGFTLVNWIDSDPGTSDMWWVVTSLLTDDLIANCPPDYIPSTPTVVPPTPTPTPVFQPVYDDFFPMLGSTPALMGQFGLHIPHGTDSWTIDTVPLNAEPCIDGGNCSNTTLYNPNNPIPVYMPYSGCIMTREHFTFLEMSLANILLVDSETACINRPNTQLFMSLTHLSDEDLHNRWRGSGEFMPRGELLGQLCAVNQSNKDVDCYLNGANTHLATAIYYLQWIPGVGYEPRRSEWITSDQVLRLFPDLHDCVNLGYVPEANPIPAEHLHYDQCP